MEFTGERYVPELAAPQISYEHWHRYLYTTLLAKERTVLDVGSGEGYGSYLLALHAKKVVGLDISREAVLHAASKYVRANLTFEIGSAGQLPSEWKELFDVVVSFETLEHLSDTEQESFLSDVKRTLKPDGLLIISTPNKLIYTDLPDHQNDFHVKELYLKEFKDLLAAHFETVRLLGQRVYPISYMWDLNGMDSSDLAEFRLAPSEVGFRPSDEPKLVRYAIGICSDNPIQAVSASVLVDLAGDLPKDEPGAQDDHTQLEGLIQEKAAIEQQLNQIAQEKAAVMQQIQQLGQDRGAAEQRTRVLAEEKGAAMEQSRQLASAMESAERRIQELEKTLDEQTVHLEKLGNTFDEQTMNLQELAASVEYVSKQKDELRARFLDAQDLLVRRDDEIRLLRMREGLPGSPGIGDGNLGNVEAELRRRDEQIAELQSMLYRIHHGWAGRFFRLIRAILTLGRRH